MANLCKACKEPIEETATKCPKCQAYQQWYRNPQWLSLAFFLCFLVFLFWSSLNRARPETFASYKNKVEVSVVGEQPDGNFTLGKRSLLTVQINNRTDKAWKRPKFEVESLNAEGKVIGAEHLTDYNVVVAPNSSTLVTLPLRVVPAEPVAQRRVALTDFDSNRF